MATCAASDTQGYIINIKTGSTFGQGTQTTTDTLVYSFSERRTPRRLDLSSGVISEFDSNTILYNDVGYRLATVQYARVLSLSGTFSNVIYTSDQLYGQPRKGWLVEVIITFSKIRDVDVGEDLILLRFPLFNRGQESASGYPLSRQVLTYLQEAKNPSSATIPTVKSLAPFFTDGITGKAEYGYWTYVSCVNVNNVGKSIRTFMFPGHILDTDVGTFIPQIATQPIKVYTGYPALAINNEPISLTDITRAVYLTKKPVASGSARSTADLNKSIYQYKCMPIDIMKDVGENSTLRIDPVTGQPLADLVDAETSEARLLLPAMNMNKVATYLEALKWIAIVLATIVVVCGLIYFVGKGRIAVVPSVVDLFRKSKGITPVADAAAAAAAAAQAATATVPTAAQLAAQVAAAGTGLRP